MPSYRHGTEDQMRVQNKVGQFHGGVQCLIAGGFTLTRDQNQVVYELEVSRIKALINHVEQGKLGE